VKTQAISVRAVSTALVIATAMVVTGPVLAQDGARETLSLRVECRDTAEMTREICFPYRVSNLEVTLLPPSTGSAEIIDKQIDSDSGCVTVKFSARGERRLTAQSPGSFESRAANAQARGSDPLQINQCVSTNVNVLVKIKY
jgi:hypothetical protein